MSVESSHNAPAASQATDSFLRRLAGQSVNKAGIGKDQATVNRTIYEASKGTKFYKREHEKDLELGRKIDRLLKRVCEESYDYSRRRGLSLLLTWDPTRTTSTACFSGTSSCHSPTSRSSKPSAMTW